MVVTAWFVVVLYALVFGSIVLGGILLDLKCNGHIKSVIFTTKQQLVHTAQSCNQQIKQLERNFKTESNQSTLFQQLSGYSYEAVRKRYEREYQQVKSGYRRESQMVLNRWDNAKQMDRNWTRFWRVTIGVGVFTLFAACSHTLISQNEVAGTMAAKQADHYWKASDIPMPHLQDASRYVSNPDSIVSEETVQRMDRILKQMDDSLGIESVVAIVKHVDGGDIAQFAQDIFDIYKVGKDDYGLVMVLAYDDHLFRTHTGRSLEAELTDIECFRLQERYLIPSMKAEMPDSGMLYMTQAIYNTLSGKELPVLSEWKKNEPSSGSDDDSLLAVYVCICLGWLILYLFIASRHGWHLHRYAHTLLLPNPFVAHSSAPIIIPTGGGGRHGGGFGGGFSGGSFGGGSSGGGGATSSW